jgi:hypothetical protein
VATTAKKKKVSPFARMGKSNGRWKGGTSKTYYRKKAGAKAGQVVHHKDHNKKNTKKSNLKLVTKAQHNKEHPEKGGHHPKGSGKRGRKRK